MEYATYQTTPSTDGKSTFYFTDCCNNRMFYFGRDDMKYHDKLCPGCMSKGKMTTLYLRGTDEGNCQIAQKPISSFCRF